MGTAETKRAVASARLRTDFFMMRLLGRKDAQSQA
jgi:hypothetical protein